jgi:TPR repeat protein
MAKVFLAYARKDEVVLLKFADALRRFGFEVFTDRDIPAGQNWWVLLTQEIERCSCVIALWSKDAAKSDHVKFEAAIGYAGKKLISILTDSASLPDPFKSDQAIDFRGWDGGALTPAVEKLIRRLHQATGREPNRERFLDTPKARTRSPGRTVVLATIAGLAAVSLLIVAGVSYLRQQPDTGAAVESEEFAPEPAEAENPTITAEDLELRTLESLAADLAALPEESLTQIASNAEQDGSAAAIACVAHLNTVPGFASSRNDAKTNCERAAALGHPAGHYLLWANRSAFGINEDAARSHLASAASAHWAPAEVDMAALLSNEDERGRLLESAARDGYFRGELQYAVWLRDSLAGPRDPNAARVYFERADAQGSPEAANALGALHRDGILNSGPDAARARHYFQRAATAGFPAGKLNLSDLLAESNAEHDRETAESLRRELACITNDPNVRRQARARLGRSAPQC